NVGVLLDAPGHKNYVPKREKIKHVNMLVVLRGLPNYRRGH
ncbi:11648_t:CDS:2, partial [Funneliformis mosseae]